jgi:uncharacterized coiled-coil protein SlyX
MDKEATIIQTYNDEKCQYEYRVKGYDITESVKVLLKAHKEEYDRQKFNFGEVKGYCDGMRDAEKKITDLEAKLAEKEQYLEAVVEADKVNYERLHNEIAELKQQLAEKDKEIETIKKDSDKNIDYLVEFASLIESEKDCNRMLKALERVREGKKYIVDKDHNQDKIELLEKVRELFDYEDYYCYGDNNINIVINRNKFNNDIDTLIKEIKGE